MYVPIPKSCSFRASMPMRTRTSYPPLYILQVGISAFDGGSVCSLPVTNPRLVTASHYRATTTPFARRYARRSPASPG
jgi:hypothetical protein